MAKEQNITTFSEAAAELGLTPNSIGPLVSALGIKHKSVPRNGNAKGLDDDDMATLKAALRKRKPKPDPAKEPAGLASTRG